MGCSIKVKATLLVAAILTGTIGVTGSAQADYQPSATDVVGLGADTLDFAMDFAVDGDPSGGLGYNAANNANKLVVFDSAADGNGRNAYIQGSTSLVPLPLNPTVVLRAGTTPVLRPTSSVDSFNTLLADHGLLHNVDFINTTALPNTLQRDEADAAGWEGLHVVQIASDPLQMVAATTTNAPPGLTVQQLLGIYLGTYQHWNEIPGNAGGSTETIVPLITPVDSDSRTTFLNDLRAANGNNLVVPFAGVRTVGPNDPADITGLSPAERPNAIMPFALGRLNLWNAGYFHDPLTNVVLNANVKALTGTPPGGGAFYSHTIPLYIIFRQTDTTLGPWQPGSTKNWVQTLFSDPGGSPFFSKPSTQALIQASGVTPLYNDLGNVSSGSP